MKNLKAMEAEYIKQEILMYVDELLDMMAKDLIKETDLKDPVPDEIVVHIKDKECVHGDVAESSLIVTFCHVL